MPSKLKKVGVLKVKDGTFIDKNGKERNRYHEIAVVFATPHLSRVSLKFHSTASGEGPWAELFWDEDGRPKTSTSEDGQSTQQKVAAPTSMGPAKEVEF